MAWSVGGYPTGTARFVLAVQPPRPRPASQSVDCACSGRNVSRQRGAVGLASRAERRHERPAHDEMLTEQTVWKPAHHTGGFTRCPADGSVRPSAGVAGSACLLRARGVAAKLDLCDAKSLACYMSALRSHMCMPTPLGDSPAVCGT